MIVSLDVSVERRRTEHLRSSISRSQMSSLQFCILPESYWLFTADTNFLTAAKLQNQQFSCLYRAPMTIKTLYYTTDAQIYNS